MENRGEYEIEIQAENTTDSRTFYDTYPDLLFYLSKWYFFHRSSYAHYGIMAATLWRMETEEETEEVKE